MSEFSRYAAGIQAETAFTVLAAARRLKAAGKEVIELEIGDSPFPSTPAAVAAGLQAMQAGQHHYGPSIGLPEFRRTAAEFVRNAYGLDVGAEHVAVAPGAKPFQLFFCEALLNPGDGVLVFSPAFPTYVPNIARRGARVWFSPLKQENEFRPSLADVKHFLDNDPQPKAIFLNSPHNPTGGVAAPEDLKGIADLVRGRNISIFSDEPYDRMVWQGRHESILAQPGMLAQGMAAYTFSKSYSMSGWRLGFSVCDPALAEMVGKLVNTTLSCVPPFVQLAGLAALEKDNEERDRRMAYFRSSVERLVAGLNKVPHVRCLMPAGTFYVFPSVAEICNRHGITSHGLAMYLLEGADDARGVACLGGECFGEAGAGFLRFSCAEPPEKLDQAVAFVAEAFERGDRVAKYLADRPNYRLAEPYASAS